MLLEQALTNEERLADLDLATLKQLVGLVEYDYANDPFPVTGWDSVVWSGTPLRRRISTRTLSGWNSAYRDGLMAIGIIMHSCSRAGPCGSC